MKRLLFFLFTAAVLASCGEETVADQPVGADDDDAGTSVSLAGTWVLADLSVDGAAVELPPTPLTITIDSGLIEGQGGCNRFEGDINRGDDGSLALTSLIQTEMACEQLAFEMTYTGALTAVDRWEASPDAITFASDNARITYRAVPEEAATNTTALTDTVWLLDTVFGPGEGPQRAASSIDPSAGNVEAVFGEANLTVSSDRCTDVTFTIATTEGNGGGSFEIIEQQDRYECQGSESLSANLDLALSGVGEATGYMIDANRLTLLGDEGELIGFVSQ